MEPPRLYSLQKQHNRVDNFEFEMMQDEYAQSQPVNGIDFDMDFEMENEQEDQDVSFMQMIDQFKNRVNEELFLRCLGSLNSIITNLLKPEVQDKHKWLPLQNQKIQELILGQDEILSIVMSIGFEFNTEMTHLHLQHENRTKLIEANQILSNFLNQPPNEAIEQKVEIEIQNPVQEQPEQQVIEAEVANPLHSLHLLRQQRKLDQPHQVQPFQTQQSQMQQYRNQQRNNYLDQNRGKFHTIQSLETKQVENERFRLKCLIGSNHRDQMGLKCLELTNLFRQQQGKTPMLIWCDQLHHVALEHSQKMSEGKVPLGHRGFKGRHEQYKKLVSFQVNGFSENVAYNYGHDEPPKCAVDGWISSKGHRANMLSFNHLCAIAVVQKDGKYWFTQLFARK